MIILYILFFIFGVAVFMLMKKLSLPIRIAISFGAFLILSLITTLWLLQIGDKPLPDAVTVYQEKAIENPKDVKIDDKKEKEGRVLK